MKKIFRIVVTLFAAGLVCLAVSGCSYNKMVSMDEAVDAQWAQVQNQYQRRLDLIPNLVNTVKGYAKHEAQVFEEIAQARSRAGGMVNVDKSILEDPKAFEQFQQVQNELGASLQRLLVVSENYPELKADQNFLALQDQLEGTENRIATERQKFNELVKSYNALIRSFPSNITAGMFKFEKKQYFSANQQAQSAPEVEF